MSLWSKRQLAAGRCKRCGQPRTLYRQHCKESECL